MFICSSGHVSKVPIIKCVTLYQVDEITQLHVHVHVCTVALAESLKSFKEAS